MGFILSKISWFWTPAGYDVPDPATGLTPRQKDLVQSTWKIVRSDARNNGIKLFLKFFTDHPEYQPLFKGFASVPKSELPKNGKVLAHAMSVMYALNSIVDNLNDVECLVEILNKVGINHKPRNITPQHFMNLGIVVLGFLKEELGPTVMNKTAEEAWRKSLEVANSVIIKALEEES